MRIIPLAMMAALPIVFGCSSASNEKVPVTTSEAAIQKAKEAWVSIYDKASWQTAYRSESTAKFEPYTATLQDGVWLVRGTIPPNYQGDVLETTVQQSDGSASVTVVQVK
jgi:hypothetical protein